MVYIWIGFIGLVLAMLALDLGVFHRKAHVVTVREALGWSAIWISSAAHSGQRIRTASCMSPVISRTGRR